MNYVIHLKLSNQSLWLTTMSDRSCQNWMRYPFDLTYYSALSHTNNNETVTL